MGMGKTLKFALAIILIVLNVIGFTLGTVLMSLAAWQWGSYAANPALYNLTFGVHSRELLIFFMTSGSALILLSILGIIAGHTVFVARLKYITVALLLVYTVIIFALYTFEIISVTLDYSQFFAGKETVSATVGGSFANLLQVDGYWNSSSAEFFNNWQTNYQCCGWDDGSAYGWSLFAKWDNNNTHWRPASCCKYLNATNIWEKCTANHATYYWPGCRTSFLTSYSNLEWSVVGLSISASVVEGLALVFSLLLVGLVMSSGPCPEKE